MILKHQYGLSPFIISFVNSSFACEPTPKRNRHKERARPPQSTKIDLTFSSRSQTQRWQVATKHEGCAHSFKLRAKFKREKAYYRYLYTQYIK